MPCIFLFIPAVSMENICGVLVLLFILWLHHVLGFFFLIFQVYLFVYLGIHEISADVYMPVDHSSSGDSEKSDSSWNDCMSDEEQRSKKEPEDAEEKRGSDVYKAMCCPEKWLNCWTQWRWKRSWKHVTSQWESGPKSSLGEDEPPAWEGLFRQSKTLASSHKG